jgi:hypothetical protein
MILVTVLVGCSDGYGSDSVGTSSTNNRFQDTGSYYAVEGSYRCHILVDTETDNVYLYVTGSTPAPLYDADGNIVKYTDYKAKHPGY